MKKLVMFFLFCFAVVSFAEERKIGEVATKGIVLRKKIEICAIEDPDIKGITIFYTKTVVPGILYNEYGTDSSISVRQTGQIIGTPSTKENLLQHSSNLFFKKLVIDRFYDQTSNSLIYLVYTTATDGNNNAHSISVVTLTRGLE